MPLTAWSWATFVVENISLPDELQKLLDQRIGMKMMGDLGSYTQFAAAQAMGTAAANPNGAAGLGMGLGAGAAVAQAMAAALHPAASAPTAVAEPPVAGATKFCIECGHATFLNARILRRLWAGAMNCPSCGAPMQLKAGMDSFRYDYCHAVYLPEKDDDGVRVLGEPTYQSCPVCSVTMSQASVAGFNIIYCTQCRHVDPDKENFKCCSTVRSQQRDAVAQPGRGWKRPAPHPQLPQMSPCHGEAHLYAGPGNVVIDSCDTCSLNWLDHGELMRIAHSPDEHRQDSFLDSVPTYHDTRYQNSGRDPYSWDRGWDYRRESPAEDAIDLAAGIASLFLR